MHVQRSALSPTRETSLSRYAVVALLMLCGVHVAEAIATRTWLYADGVYCLLDILEKGSFVSWQWSRSFTIGVSQIPVVAALRAGVVNLRVLSLLYGVGLYAPYVLCVSVCLWVSEREGS
jgi:hypothetical protein